MPEIELKETNIIENDCIDEQQKKEQLYFHLSKT